jgi:hypothetical protein
VERIILAYLEIHLEERKAILILVPYMHGLWKISQIVKSNAIIGMFSISYNPA